MPEPLDLTGRRFGRLTVLRRDGRVKFGRDQAAWLCRCDCGAEIRVPQDRLPHRPSIDQHHAVHACPACRAAPCVVCGAPVPPRRWGQPKTCSPSCAVAHRRRKYREFYYRLVAHDPGLTQRRSAERRDRIAQDPATASRYKAHEKRAQQRKAERLRSDPAYREHVRARARASYAKRAAETQRRRRERLAAMTPEQRERWLDRIRRYQRAYAERYRAEIRADPERHQAYLDLQREYRRQYALSLLAEDAAALVKRLGDA